jgi:deoxyribonucleoside regulator
MMPTIGPSSTESVERLELLATVANMYYIENQDQRDIAISLDVSRSTISRMISEAHKLGIVSIRINRPMPVDAELRSRAMERYPLQEALILARPLSPTGPIGIAQVGVLAANYLGSVLPQNGTLAISWGTSIAAVVEALPEDPSRQIRIVQMIGAVGSNQPSVDGAELARSIAKKLGGPYLTLNAPLILDDPLLLKALLRQKSVASVLRAAADADVALIGLGGIDPGVSSILRAGFSTRRELLSSASDGAVGEVGGHMLDRAGNVISTDLSRRMVCLDEPGLRGINSVVAIAVGAAKAEIINAALLSGIVDVIATDADTMMAVLALSDEQNRDNES